MEDNKEQIADDVDNKTTEAARELQFIKQLRADKAQLDEAILSLINVFEKKYNIRLQFINNSCYNEYKYTEKITTQFDMFNPVEEDDEE